MDLIEIMGRYPDQESCIAHLERISWRGTPVCSHCGCIEVTRKKEEDVGHVGRWHCSACHASFKVTCGTVFYGTKILLQKWFLPISLIVNAKKGLSSYQLQRDLDLNQKIAWYILTRIRAEMSKKGGALLRGVWTGCSTRCVALRNLSNEIVNIIQFFKKSQVLDVRLSQSG